MSWELLEGDAALARALEANAGATAVAVDTEFMRRNTYFPKVALVQLCFGGTALLIDPLSLDDPSPLSGLLTDPSITKVLHSASEDLEVFDHWLGVLPAPLFDTQRAAALLDRGFGLSYRALVEAVCGVDLPKGETRSDWLQRPLTESQCEYAAQDVTYLVSVYQDLLQGSQQHQRLDWILADGADAVANFGAASRDYHRRIKSGWKLDAAQLGCLQAISAWRESTARQRDKPRGWIIDDKACFELARNRPDDLRELAEVTGLPHGAVRRFGDELLELIRAQEAVAVGDLPEPLPGPLSAPQRNTLKSLKQRARVIAESLGMAPEVLLPGKDYELLIREGGGETIAIPGHWHGWRAGHVIAPLRLHLMERGE